MPSTPSTFTPMDEEKAQVTLARPFKARAAGVVSVFAASALLLSACADDGSNDADDDTDVVDSDDADDDDEDAEASGLVTVEDDFGTHEFDVDEMESIGAFDNRLFRTLQDFGVELSVAPVDLMNNVAHEEYVNDDSIANTGNHQEPNLELIAAEEPDLLINGQRYSQYLDDILDLLPEDTVVLQFDEDLEADGGYFDGLETVTEKLGTVFDEEDAADELIAELDEAMDRVSEAYDGESTVMGLLTSGGDINYAGPEEGRAVAPVFQAFDLEPALNVDDQSSDHEGDDISVEAIADSDPDWIIVLDRDGMNAEDDDYVPAQDLIADSPALQEVTAVEDEQIVYMPQNMYVTEDIQAYTEFLNDLADALEDAE